MSEKNRLNEFLKIQRGVKRLYHYPRTVRKRKILIMLSFIACLGLIFYLSINRIMPMEVSRICMIVSLLIHVFLVKDITYKAARMLKAIKDKQLNFWNRYGSSIEDDFKRKGIRKNGKRISLVSQFGCIEPSVLAFFNKARMLNIVERIFVENDEYGQELTTFLLKKDFEPNVETATDVCDWSNYISLCLTLLVV